MEDLTDRPVNVFKHRLIQHQYDANTGLAVNGHVWYQSHVTWYEWQL